MHFIDRVVHCRDQRGDGTTVEWGEEGSSNLRQDLPRDVVGLMLLPLDLDDVFLVRSASIGELAHGIGRRDQGRSVGLEHAEKVACPRQQALEPSKHLKPLSATLSSNLTVP